MSLWLFHFLPLWWSTHTTHNSLPSKELFNLWNQHHRNISWRKISSSRFPACSVRIGHFFPLCLKSSTSTPLLFSSRTFAYIYLRVFLLVNYQTLKRSTMYVCLRNSKLGNLSRDYRIYLGLLMSVCQVKRNCIFKKKSPSLKHFSGLIVSWETGFYFPLHHIHISDKISTMFLCPWLYPLNISPTNPVLFYSIFCLHSYLVPWKLIQALINHFVSIKTCLTDFK